MAEDRDRHECGQTFVHGLTNGPELESGIQMKNSIGNFRSAFTFTAMALSLVVMSVVVAHADEKKAEPAKGAGKTRDVKVDDITLTVPESWKQQEAKGPFRVAQFEIPPVDGDSEAAELAVSYSQGNFGGIEGNVKRWVGQFESKGRKAKAAEGKSKQGEYGIADITGTYNKPIGPPIRRQTTAMPGARMIAALLLVNDGKGSYSLKLTGPEKTVSAAADAFRISFGADAKSEKELKLASE